MFEVYCLTNQGLVYDHNEDSYCVNDNYFQDVNFSSIANDDLLACVFDGVGGAESGEIVSSFCAKMFSELDRSVFINNNSIKENIRSINKAVINEFGANKSASTLAGVYINNDVTKIFNIGDSRVYRISNNLIHQYTVDDTLETIGERSHVITNYFGNNDLIEYEIHLMDCSFGEGDIILICSDGVSDYCDLDEIFDENGENNLETIALNIQKEIISNGAKDNYTILLIRK